jgi:septum formation protein
MLKRIILASQSPRRKQLLDQLGFKYEILVPHIDETLPASVNEGSSPGQLATELARQKAFAIGEELRKNGNNSADEVIIIAADTIVVLDNKLFGKPNSPAEAKAILQSLCGKTHQVYTGVALLVYNFTENKMHCLTESENSLVSFRKYEDAEIEAYIETGEPMDKAGAYALQGVGACLVAKIDGCYTNVIGLPMPKVVKMLREVGIPVLGQ